LEVKRGCCFARPIPFRAALRTSDLYFLRQDRHPHLLSTRWAGYDNLAFPFGHLGATIGLVAEGRITFRLRRGGKTPLSKYLLNLFTRQRQPRREVFRSTFWTQESLALQQSGTGLLARGARELHG